MFFMFFEQPLDKNEIALFKDSAKGLLSGSAKQSNIVNRESNLYKLLSERFRLAEAPHVIHVGYTEEADTLDVEPAYNHTARIVLSGIRIHDEKAIHNVVMEPGTIAVFHNFGKHKLTVPDVHDAHKFMYVDVQFQAESWSSASRFCRRNSCEP